MKINTLIFVFLKGNLKIVMKLKFFKWYCFVSAGCDNWQDWWTYDGISGENSLLFSVNVFVFFFLFHLLNYDPSSLKC